MTCWSFARTGWRMFFLWTSAVLIPSAAASCADHVDYFGVYSSSMSWRWSGMSAAPRLETADGIVSGRAGRDHSVCQGAGAAQGVVQRVQLPAVAARHRPVLLRWDRAAVRPGVGQHVGGPRRLQVQCHRPGLLPLLLLQCRQKQQLLLLLKVREIMFSSSLTDDDHDQVCHRGNATSLQSTLISGILWIHPRCVDSCPLNS